jgi:hypothetical protein
MIYFVFKTKRENLPKKKENKTEKISWENELREESESQLNLNELDVI